MLTTLKDNLNKSPTKSRQGKHTISFDRAGTLQPDNTIKVDGSPSSLNKRNSQISLVSPGAGLRKSQVATEADQNSVKEILSGDTAGKALVGTTQIRITKSK
mgnify:CR=1 FL=1